MSVAQDVRARQPEFDQQVETGQRRRTGAAGDQLDLRQLLADHLQAVEDRRRHDDCGAMLVIVEHRDLHALAQPALDVEALRRLDVLEVDAAEGGLEGCDDFDQRVEVLLADLDVEHVDAGELLEQHALAFHHRLGHQRADVAQTQHGRAVGDDTDQVGARRVARRTVRIGSDRFRGRRHAGRIGQRQVALIDQLLGRCGRDFSWPRLFVILERSALQVGVLFVASHSDTAQADRRRIIVSSYGPTRHQSGR
jgi:hypothetical protein